MQHICRTKEAPFLRTLAIINDDRIVSQIGGLSHDKHT